MAKEGKVLLKSKDIPVLRAAKGWSQEELSRRSGVCRTSISHFENGLRIRPRHEKAIIEALLEVE